LRCGRDIKANPPDMPSPTTTSLGGSFSPAVEESSPEAKFQGVLVGLVTLRFVLLLAQCTASSWFLFVQVVPVALSFTIVNCAASVGFLTFVDFFTKLTEETYLPSAREGWRKLT
jgi:hypothetical protein